jgi:hypothetical protein
MRRTLISFAVATLALSACGGGDDDSATADPPAATDAANADGGAGQSTDAPDNGGGATTAPSDDGDVATDVPPPGGLAGNTAVVTIGDLRYEFDVTPSAVYRCDPDFFGAFWALGKDADNNGIELMIPPEGDPNFEDAPYLKVKDQTLDTTWVATPDQEIEGVEPGDSQIDSSSIDGGHLSGTATFADQDAYFAFQYANGEQPHPVTGTFEVLCADG